MQDVHFIRPEWFWALIPFAIIVALLVVRKRQGGQWQHIIDKQLLPHVLIGKVSQQRYWPLVLLSLAGILSIIAMAGPAWKQLPQPVFRTQSALVIILDLSRSMDTADIKPSRLTRAKHKITDILKQRTEGQTALIVYAASAFVVTPLTTDTETIQSQIPSLQTSIMPAQGSRADLALTKANELFTQSSVNGGQILLITDGINSEQSSDAAKKLLNNNHSINILGLGTPAGAPIPARQGDFLKDAQGSIVIAKLDEYDLQKFTAKHNGIYSRITTNDADIKILLNENNIDRLNNAMESTDFKTDTWQEEGPWLLLLITPIVALAFRRGLLILAIAFILPFPNTSHAFSWADLWKNNNQQGQAAFEAKKYTDAAKLYNDEEWQAAAHYRAGEYQAAIDKLNKLSDIEKNPNALYNKGNALAKAGKIPEAINAYNQALKINPEHEDAKYNRDLLQQQQNQQDNNQQSNENSDDSEQSNSDQNQNQQQDQSQNQSDEQSSDESSDQSQNQSEQQSEKQSNQESNDQSNAEQQNQQQESDNEQQTEQKQKNTQQQQTNKEQTDQEQTDQEQAQSQQRAEHSESDQALEQWLRRIPDDPGGLLRRKFQHQYKKQKNKPEQQKW